MRIFKLSTLIFLALSFFIFSSSVGAQSPKPMPQPTQVNSYELFWPIVAGRVQGDSLYGLKMFKEKVRGFFIFSSLKKAEYNAVLSQKRLLEFEKLAITNNDLTNSTKTLDVMTKTQDLAIVQLKKAKGEGLDVSLSTQTISTIFDKELSLLESVLIKVDDSQKELVTKALSNLETLKASL